MYAQKKAAGAFALGLYKRLSNNGRENGLGGQQ